MIVEHKIYIEGKFKIMSELIRHQGYIIFLKEQIITIDQALNLINDYISIYPEVSYIIDSDVVMS